MRVNKKEGGNRGPPIRLVALWIICILISYLIVVHFVSISCSTGIDLQDLTESFLKIFIALILIIELKDNKLSRITKSFFTKLKNKIQEEISKRIE